MAEIAEAAANTSAEGGAEEASQELSQTKNSLVSELRAYLTELNSFYAQTTDATHIDQLVEERANRMRELIENANIDDDVMNAIRHPSSRGKADIIDDDEVQQKVNDLNKRKAQAYKALYGARADVYKLNNAKLQDDKFKEVALRGMQIVYKIRQIILGGAEERIAVTFAESGYLKVVTIPMSEFLKNATNLISVTTESFSKQMYGDPYKLALRNSRTVIEQMKNLQGASVQNIVANGKQITTQMFEELKKNRDFLLRYGDGYKVVSKGGGKGQSGFIAEALVRATLTGEPFEYRQDREAWYQDPDVINKLGLGFSVKNALGSNPTLLRINSLQTVVTQLIQELSAINTSPSEMINNIKTKVFGQVSDLDGVVEEHILKMVSEGLGI